MSKSENLYSAARELIPGGVNSPVRAFTGVGGTPLFIEKADGAYLYDVIHNKLNTRQTSGCLYWCNPDFLEYKSFVHLKHYALQRIFMERASKMPSSYLYDQ